MKKYIFLTFFIGISAVIFYVSNSNKSDLPAPKFVPFEKQEIVGFYEWSLIGPSGTTKNMFIDKDIVILIHLWDLNDPKAVEELESLQTIYDEYKTKAQFYFVTKNKQVEVRNFIKDNGFTFPVFFSLSPIPKPMSLDSVPATYLLNKKGRIVVDSKVASNWDDDEFRVVMNDLIKK